MIAFARVFSDTYYNLLKEGFFESFSKSNVINECIRNKGDFFQSNNELPNSSVSIKEDSFVSINLQSKWFCYHQIRDSEERNETLIRYLYHNWKEN